MSRRTRETQRDIIFALNVIGFGASAQWIADAVNWDRGRTALQHLLRRMVSSHLLTQPRHGHYDINPRWREFGPGSFGAVENAIADEMKRQGGAATTGDLFKAAFGAVERFATSARTYEHRLLHEVLRASGWFERVADGYWRLVPGADEPWGAVPSGSTPVCV
jgi:hypothetical protein